MLGFSPGLLGLHIILWLARISQVFIQRATLSVFLKLVKPQIINFGANA